jgi:hypothetical protein
MLSHLAGGLIDIPWQAVRAAGVLALASGDAVSHGSKVVPIVIGFILGTSCGAISGLILARLLRFIAYMAGRRVDGNFLILIGALAGAACLVWMAATRGSF